LRRFGIALRLRALASLLLARERRRIASLKAQDYADTDGLHQGFATREMGFNDKFAVLVRFERPFSNSENLRHVRNKRCRLGARTILANADLPPLDSGFWEKIETGPP
jgi:hypothetical protein